MVYGIRYTVNVYHIQHSVYGVEYMEYSSSDKSNDSLFCDTHCLCTNICNMNTKQNFSSRWTHTNFSTFHTIQILTVIVNKLM
jgi:hypothetical protein